MTTTSQTVALRLTLIVDYDLQGESIETLKEILLAIPKAAELNGELTQDTNAEVSKWKSEVDVVFVGAPRTAP